MSNSLESILNKKKSYVIAENGVLPPLDASQLTSISFASSAGYAQEVGQHNHSAVQIIDLNTNVSSIVSSFKASSDAFGLVKIGEGINVSQGVISVDVGSLNESSNKVAHFDAMPDPESSIDQVAIYTGETDSSYAKGHVYKKEQSGGSGGETVVIIQVSDDDYSDIAGTYQVIDTKTMNCSYYDASIDDFREITLTNVPIFKNNNNVTLEFMFDDAGGTWFWSFYNNDYQFIGETVDFSDSGNNEQNINSVLNNISKTYYANDVNQINIDITATISSESSSINWVDITPDEGGLNRIITSSNVTAQSGNWYLCNANVTITLPASPNQGDVVRVSSISSANNISIVPSGTDTIENQIEFIIDVANSSVELMYNGSMWVVSQVVAKSIRTSNFTKSILPIGTIFYHISSTPPEGAFLLNGQIIYNCSTLYPEFYQYITSNNNIRKITTSVYESELSSVGICGGFVVDAENGSIRLPNISNGFIEGSNGSNVGSTINDGLPNITGHLEATYATFRNEYSGAFNYSSSSNSLTAPAFPNDKYTQNMNFNAHDSNPIYGRSNTVQPKSVFYSVCIQVFNAATNLSTQVSAQLTSELQNKVGINAENFTAAGKNNILDYTFDLDYNNDNIVYVSAFNTYYQAQRTGFLEVVLQNSSANAVNCYLRVSSTMENTVISTGFSILGNNATTGLNIIVPKGMYYYIGCVNTSAITLQRARFIPFKNSISSNS